MSAADLGHTEGTNTSQSSGSQDSIDLDTLLDTYLIKMYHNGYTDHIAGVTAHAEAVKDQWKAEAKERLTAWHNTQLKERTAASYSQGYDDCLREHGAVFKTEED